MKYNYHTHTFRCHHAEGKDEEYVLRAIEAGYEEIGFSDHCAWPFEDGYVSYMRMIPDEIEEYTESVKALREKYKDKIRIKLGWECEYFERHMDWLKETAKKYGFDYFILGHHYTPYEIGGVYNGMVTDKDGIEAYKNDVLKALDTGLFSYVAHPDLYMRQYGDFDEHCEKAAREIIAKAIETDTPLEYNLLGIFHAKNDGFPGYPNHGFWKIAGEMGAKAVVGIDAHTPDAYFWEEMRNEAFEKLRGYGVKLTEEIRFFDKS